MLDQMNVHFYGFSPSDFTREFLMDKLEAIYDEAPYGAQMRAVFSRRQDTFKGVITIHSPVGKFLAVSSGPKLKAVTHNLTDQIRRQLRRWKSKRFDRVSLKSMPIKNYESDDPVRETDSVA